MRPFIEILEKLRRNSKAKYFQNKNVIINIVFSGLAKILTIITTLYFMRISIDQLNKNQFGLWLTLYSLVNWMTLFDLGFGNGLRNKLTESIEKGDSKRAKILVSSTYFILIIIFGVISIVSIFGSLLVNTGHSHFESNTLLVFNIVFVGNCILFILKLIHVPFQSTHRNYVPDVINVMVQLMVIVLIKISHVGDIVVFSWVNLLTPIIIYFALTLFFYNKEFKPFSPSIKAFQKSSAQEMASVSSGFFIIQVIGIIIFSSDNFIISYFLNFEEVTSYNILYRFYSVLMVAFGVIVSPYWSLSASAFSKGNFLWISKSISTLNFVCIGIGIIALMMTFWADNIIYLWLGTLNNIPILSLLLMMTYITVLNFAAIYNTVNYGIGNILPIVKVSIIGVVINLSGKLIALKQFNLGIDGIIIANLIYALMALFMSKISLASKLSSTSFD